MYLRLTGTRKQPKKLFVASGMVQHVNQAIWWGFGQAQSAYDTVATRAPNFLEGLELEEPVNTKRHAVIGMLLTLQG